ncbi:MAG: TlpA disulfide reductase family protein [Pyrinomonadaceae bacterium]
MKKVFLSFLLTFLSVIAINAQTDEIKSYTKVGQEMPDFTVTDANNKEFKISDLKGKIVYINFWATWCPPCLEEMPRIEKEIWQKNKQSENFVMAAIAREQTQDEIAPFIKKYGYTFPTAADTDRAIFKLFGDGGIPRSYVIGTDGKILFQSVGYNEAEFDRMKNVIEKELEKVKRNK